MNTTVDGLYGDFWLHPRLDFEERLREARSRRGRGLLLEVFRDTGVGPEHTVLDVGCRDAAVALQLAREFGCRVIALDLCEANAARAREQVAEAGKSDRIDARAARIEALPLEDGSVDRIWCRDMLNHTDLPAALAECRRVLRPGGRMVVFQTLATELMEPREAARLYAALAIVAENMACATFERTAQAAGFAIIRRELQGSESREEALEQGEASFDAVLLRLARMRRLEEELVLAHGRAFYEAAYAGELWGVYQLLGKLFNYLHVLERP